MTAGAAAWSVTAPDRHGVDEQLAAARVAPAAREAYLLCATATILLSPYIIGQAVALAITARTAPPGFHLWIGYFVFGAFVLLVAIAVGWLMGKIFNAAIAALTAPLGFLLLIGILDQQGSFAILTGRPAFVIDSLSLLLRTSSIVAFLVTLLWISKSKKVKLRKFGLSLATAIAVIISMLATPVVVPRNPPGNNILCIEGRSQLCIWPEHEKYLSDIRTISTRINALPGNFSIPVRMNEYGIDSHSYLANEREQDLDAAPYFQIIAGSPWSYGDDIGKAILSLTFQFLDRDACNWQKISDDDANRLWTLEAWLTAYLVGGGAPDSITNAPSEMQYAWKAGRTLASNKSIDDQISWANQEVSEIRDRYCSSSS
ncbi:hypothetical protein O7543_19675 [Solwaraspora sp. WMMA2080]|uniref:hypothetical protein n=1 Tax=unclassified Solwaraspora TaxID=2627926 RepID=UPI00248C1C85|nr:MULTISPECIES: hypothetical protein [unclassified Solwaraspora]WBB97001.1 hypothetical protein O7553_27695 [Solwaraspora sp. WMMA2059]WBC19096.1 hypothetical protein O7543_19675 [Solwaraspora sp. WMMA2080]